MTNCSWSGRQRQIERGQDAGHRAIAPVSFVPEHRHRTGDVAPDERAPVGRVFAEQTGPGQAEQRRERAAVGRRRPGDRRHVPVVVLPRGGRAVFVGEQLAEQQHRLACVIGTRLSGGRRDVRGQVLGDEFAAFVEQRELMLEVRPAIGFA